jgi:hypothetical protein
LAANLVKDFGSCHSFAVPVGLRGYGIYQMRGKKGEGSLNQIVILNNLRIVALVSGTRIRALGFLSQSKQINKEGHQYGGLLL